MCFTNLPAMWFKTLGENSKLKYNRKNVLGRVLRRHKQWYGCFGLSVPEMK